MEYCYTDQRPTLRQFIDDTLIWPEVKTECPETREPRNWNFIAVAKPKVVAPVQLLQCVTVGPVVALIRVLRLLFTDAHVHALWPWSDPLLLLLKSHYFLEVL